MLNKMVLVLVNLAKYLAIRNIFGTIFIVTLNLTQTFLVYRDTELKDNKNRALSQIYWLIYDLRGYNWEN